MLDFTQLHHLHGSLPRLIYLTLSVRSIWNIKPILWGAWRSVSNASKDPTQEVKLWLCIGFYRQPYSCSQRWPHVMLLQIDVWNERVVTPVFGAKIVQSWVWPQWVQDQFAKNGTTMIVCENTLSNMLEICEQCMGYHTQFDLKLRLVSLVGQNWKPKLELVELPSPTTTTCSSSCLNLQINIKILGTHSIMCGRPCTLGISGL